MDLTFSKTIAVLEAECDINRKISLTNVLRHVQQIGSDHLSAMGIDYERMHRDGMVFVVAKLLATVWRRPQMGEKVLLTTFPRRPHGVQFIRDTVFKGETGEKLIEVSISWLLVDPTTHKILSPAVFDRYGLEMLPNEGEQITGYRIKKPDAPGSVLHMRQIKYSDLDYNHHVNNAVYADIVCDLIPPEVMFHKEIETFGILYQREAVFGQVIELQVMPSWSKKAFYIRGLVAGEHCFEAQMAFQ